MANKLVKGKNDFESWCLTNNPNILKEYDFEKNNIKPFEVAKGSHRLLFFKCSECGTNFSRQPHYFQKNGFNGCPKCWIRRRGESRRKTATKKNNFLLTYPGLAEEWSNKNLINSSDVSFNNNKKFWWKCSRCGNEWEASISNRIKGTGCPKCKSIFHTSFPEQAIFYYVKKYFHDAINSDKHLGLELDVYIPSRKVAIEYDGEMWHQDKEKDEKKNLLCYKNNILLIRVRERNCWFWPENEFLRLIPCESGNQTEITKSIVQILNILGIYDVDVNIERDRNIILSNYLDSREDNSLLSKFPEIAKEWHPTKNLPLTPNKIDYGSGLDVFWICSKCGYEFSMTVNSRTCKGSGCPACSHRVPIVGVNDLETKCKDLMLDWDYEKNESIGLNPKSLLEFSMKEAYWKCHICGTRWRTSVSNRRQGRGCPNCAMQKKLKSVMNIEDNKVFESIKEASEYYKLQPGKISECCKGKRKTTGGYHWKYVTEEEKK